jgi:CRP-like cAMP-binding protein
MIDAHLKKLRQRDDVSPEEEQAIRDAISGTRDVAPHRVAVRPGEELSVSLLLLDGMIGRYKDLRDGGRQISQLHVAGDFVDLHGFTLKRLDHGLLALTPCRFATMPHDRLRVMTERYPHLMRVYWLMTNIDAAISREWELSLGRRSAVGRVAHLLCELFVRLDVIGLCEGNCCPLPLTQLEIAECVGLTPVHVNRMLQELRRRGLIKLQSKRLTIEDFAGLKAVAEFSPDYLYLEKRPR